VVTKEQKSNHRAIVRNMYESHVGLEGSKAAFDWLLRFAGTLHAELEEAKKDLCVARRKLTLAQKGEPE